MSILTIMPSGKQIEVAEGTSLLSALRSAGVGLAEKCENKPNCSSCHVFVQQGRKGLSKECVDSDISCGEPGV